MHCSDQIRPDWEAKLAAVKAAAARRANRRIIMRQVGDRLIPVGVTSGRVHALPAEGGEGASGDGSGSRRSRRRQQNELNQLLGSMGLGGQDLEEVCVSVTCIDGLSYLVHLTDAHYVPADGHGSHATFSSRARGTSASRSSTTNTERW